MPKCCECDACVWDYDNKSIDANSKYLILSLQKRRFLCPPHLVWLWVLNQGQIMPMQRGTRLPMRVLLYEHRLLSTWESCRGQLQNRPLWASVWLKRFQTWRKTIWSWRRTYGVALFLSILYWQTPLQYSFTLVFYNMVVFRYACTYFVKKGKFTFPGWSY